MVFPFGGVAHLLPVIQPRRHLQQGCFQFYNQIYQAVFSTNFKASVQILKKEAIPITLLFFSSLGLLPTWISVACAVSGIARLAWVLFQSQRKIIDLEKAGHRAGRLIIENGDLEAARNAAQRERNEAENVRNQLQHANEIAKLNYDQLKRENDTARQKFDNLMIEFQNEIKIHELNHEKAIGYDQINQGLADQVEVLHQERKHLTEKIQAQVANIVKLGNEREVILQKQEAALQEQIAIQYELNKVQRDPFWEEWRKIEQNRNIQLAKVSKLFQGVIQNIKENDLTQIELIAEKILPDLRKQKEDTIAILDHAMNGLTAGHPSLLGLQKLKGIYEMEKKSLEDIVTVAALPFAIRRLMTAEAGRR